MPKWTINVLFASGKSSVDPDTWEERDAELEIEAATGPKAVIAAMEKIEMEADELLHEIRGTPYVHVSRPHK